jgi:hypothetical protein
MSTPKKPATKSVKPSEPRAKYSIGQKVFIIDNARSSYGEVLQAEVDIVRSARFSALSESGKITGSEIRYEYDVRTCNGIYREKSEYALYPTLTAVSLAFTQNFTTLLK